MDSRQKLVRRCSHDGDIHPLYCYRNEKKLLNIFYKQMNLKDS